MPGYVGLRWLKLYALPTPERLERIVALAPFLDRQYPTAGAPAATPKNLADEYREFLASRQGLVMFDLACGAKDFARQPCADGTRTYLEENTPVVKTQIQDLYFHPPDLLSTAYGNGSRAYLCFMFPAAFSPPPHDQAVITDDHPNRTLYETICAEIMRGSKPVTVVGPTREWRLPLRVDPEMRGWLAAHPILVGNGLRLKG